MTPTPVVPVLTDDLIAEVISFLPVKSLLQFRCVSKYWKTLISDPSFVKLHLNKSRTRNPLFTLTPLHRGFPTSVVPYSLHRLIENPPLTLSVDPYYHLSDKGCSRIVGTCNGLILLLGYSKQYIRYFCLWNPATRTISPYRVDPPDPSFAYLDSSYRFTFGCDDFTDTYKIVASGFSLGLPNVKILSLGHNVWRDIQTGPVAPRHLQNDKGNAAVYLCSTLNWLAINNDNDNNNGYDFKNVTVDQLVIDSLDLGTETFNQYRLPSGFDEMPPAYPIVAALGGFLCFSYFYKETDFVLWQMKEFGVEDSWTQFLKISFHDLQINFDCYRPSNFDRSLLRFQIVPVLLSQDADTLVLSSQEPHPILYNWRDNRVERSKITTSGTITDNLTSNSTCWYSAKVYVESLVSTF